MWFPKKKIWLVALLAAALLAVALVRQAGQTPHPAPAAEAPAEQGAAISPQEPAAPAPEAEGTASGPQEAGGAAAPAEKEAAAADQAADAADAGAAPGEEVVRGTLEKGDTVGKLLAMCAARARVIVKERPFSLLFKKDFFTRIEAKKGQTTAYGVIDLS